MGRPASREPWAGAERAGAAVTGSSGSATGAKLAAARLAAAGVDTVFGVPGGPILPLIDAIVGHPRMRFVLTRHEEGAVFMAQGYAQASGRLGVALVTAGPGATHALTATASANADYCPVLVLTGQASSADFGRGALQDSSGVGCADTVDMFGSVTTLSAMVVGVAQLDRLMGHAIDTAMRIPQGAVHLAVTADTLTAPADPPRPAPHGAPAVRPVPPGLPAPAAREIAQVVRSSRAPLVLAGLGAKVSGANHRLIEFADRYRVGVATTFKGKGVFPEDHPRSVGVYGTLAGSEAVHAAVLDPAVDTLLVLGSALGEFATASWDPRLCAGRTVIQIDADPRRLARSFPVDIAATADITAALGDLNRASSPRRGRPETTPRGTPVSTLDAGTESDRLRASDVIAALSERTDASTLLFVDNGNCIGWVGPHYRVRPPGNMLCSLNFGAMGYSIPAAVGAKFASGDSSVVAVLGDAAFAMSGMEIHTAVEYGLPITWVVLNNSGNAMVAQVQHLLGRTVAGANYRAPIDVAAVARALGAEATTVTDAAGLDIALTTALHTKRPFLLDARVDPGEVPWGLGARAETLHGREHDAGKETDTACRP